MGPSLQKVEAALPEGSGGPFSTNPDPFLPPIEAEVTRERAICWELGRSAFSEDIL